MITFEQIKKETIYIAEEIINSNSAYNKIENGNETRTTAEVTNELLNEKTNSLFVKLDDTYIGVIDYLNNNPHDNFPWLGLLMIHSDYQNFGFGSIAYNLFEETLRHEGIETLRLGVLRENKQAKLFWERLGFSYYETKEKEKQRIDCFQKTLQK